MKSLIRIAVAALLVIIVTLVFSACSSDGYPSTTTVYVGHGYGGYGPGWGGGWGGYGGVYHPPPVIVGPPRVVHY